MTIRGWIASLSSSYYARTRNSAWTAASMLFLACALSYTRAQAGVTVGADAEFPVRDAREVIVAMRTDDPAAKKAVKAVLERADPAMVDMLLRYGRTPGEREVGQKVVVAMGRKALPAVFSYLGDPALAAPAASVMFRVLGPADADRIPELLACAAEKPAIKNYCIQSLVPVSSPKAAPHAAALAKALASADPFLKAFAATALGRIGKGAASAAPALRKALNDPAPEVQAQAKAALKRVGD
jgi:hypothetical protein